MKIIILLALSIFFYPPLTTEDEAKVNQVICEIAGYAWKTNYTFDVKQLPKGCSIYTVGEYSFDRMDKINTRVIESDKGIMRSLVEANKIVYMRIGRLDNDWSSILEPSDENVFLQQMFSPLVDFINTFNVSGIIMDIDSIYDVSMVDFEEKINKFVYNIKEKVKNLKVGTIVYGTYYNNFLNNSLFNFSKTNEELDFYMVNLLALNDCNNDTLKSGVSPVTSPDPNVTTIELVTSFVTNSSMGKSKIFAVLHPSPFIPPELLSKDEFYSVSTYSKAAYVKRFYSGIFIEYLDTDDYDEKCTCGMFPVSNQIIDGWTNSPLKTCSRLDHK